MRIQGNRKNFLYPLYICSFPNILIFTIRMHLNVKLIENYLIIFHNHRQFRLKLPNAFLICRDMLVLIYFDFSTLRFTKTILFDLMNLICLNEIISYNKCTNDQSGSPRNKKCNNYLSYHQKKKTNPHSQEEHSS